jgi:hypothetical protein
MSKQTATFGKVKDFITDQYNQLPVMGAVIVKSVVNGYKVNDILVKTDGNRYCVVKENNNISEFNQRRTAILFAALVSRKKYKDSSKIYGLDKQLDIYLEDKQFYSTRLKKNNNLIYEDRLSRVESELNIIDEQLRQLEKSVALQ